MSFKPHQQQEVGREIPIFGYNMSVKQACQVLELYRDYSYPLTKYARAVLLGYAKTIDVTVAKAAYIGDESDSGAAEATTYEDELPKTRPGVRMHIHTYIHTYINTYINNHIHICLQ